MDDDLCKYLLFCISSYGQFCLKLCRFVHVVKHGKIGDEIHELQDKIYAYKKNLAKSTRVYIITQRLALEKLTNQRHK